MVSSYFDPGTKLIYAIGAVVGLIGGVKVYGKFSSGDPDTSKTCLLYTSIYDDRVEIENSGTFPPDITMEKLLSGHNSEPQNLIIANVLYKSCLLYTSRCV